VLARMRRRREQGAELAIAHVQGSAAPHEYRPATVLEALLIALRDALRVVEFSRLARRYDLYGYDLYHFHGGIDYFRNGRWVQRLAALGKPIICNYHGPDLRSRGVVRVVDRLSSLNLTNEFDLLSLHPDLHYIPIPYDCADLPSSTPPAERLRIIHTPSVPAAKGTHLIEPVLRRVAAERRVDYTILSGVSHQRIIAEKARSHIAVEQVGNFGGTGYGVNSLETLAMNLPTITEFTPQYAAFLTNHPFVLVDKDTLYDALIRLVDNDGYRREVGMRGRRWVESQHGFAAVWRTLLDHLGARLPALTRRLEGCGS
jgi:glycosyltransferase involved in cell wall biosynthesis